jgi:hypothetical protein
MRTLGVLNKLHRVLSCMNRTCRIRFFTLDLQVGSPRLQVGARPALLVHRAIAGRTDTGIGILSVSPAR